ncbi:MAG TPA: phosphopantetheine-binding protein [Burkholderiaceae bacterium]
MKITRADFLALVHENVSGATVTRLDASQRLCDLGIDSLGFATLLFAIEDKFEIHVDDKDLAGLHSGSTLREFARVFQCLGHEIEI